ncbi:DUF6174 domain-containing protein [Streptomyces sp. NPDC088387]|uniref:DUF6174 domain-containing protein n=1 Tax=Streptomyces sp. NPDC088387 TaxID=3365859 RepID=UPI003814B316
MTAVRSRTRSVFSATAVAAALLCATAACGNEAAQEAGRGAEGGGGTPWEEPDAYVYTLTSSEGERSLIGTIRVTVRNGKVTGAVGLDDSGRRVVEQDPGEVPTVGELLEEAERARQNGAVTADVSYAADGHPTRIDLDQDRNTIDDEARYVISAYEARGRS